MPTQQQIIDAWYENFIQQISQPPFFFRPNLPEDRARLYKMLDTAKLDGTQMESPVGADEDLFEKRNELYELASEGMLYIFELGDQYNCSQIRVEPANDLLVDLKNNLIRQPEPPKPQEQTLGFFKMILNTLFGAFEEERLQLEEQYNSQEKAYNYYFNGILCENQHARTMDETRKAAMIQNQEYARANIPSILEDLNEKLSNSDALLPWQKEMYEAKALMFNAFYAGEPLTYEQRVDILTKTLVGRMGEYKTAQEERNAQGESTEKVNELQKLLHTHPEKAKEFEEMIKNSPFVQEQAAKGDATLVSHTFNPVAMDGALKNTLKSLLTGDDQNKQQVEHLKKLMRTETTKTASDSRVMGGDGR